jgi:hypothetical protein
MNAVVYKSRLDLWLLIPFTGLTVGCVCAAYAMMRLPGMAPALSLDRLRIDYGDGRSLMISPADKQGFLCDFAARRARAPM